MRLGWMIPGGWVISRGPRTLLRSLPLWLITLLHRSGAFHYSLVSAEEAGFLCGKKSFPPRTPSLCCGSSAS
jgi:hypothetical protein